MVLPDPGKLGGGELPAFGVQNPYPIICPKFVIFSTPFKTVAAGTDALNTVYDGLLLMVLSIMMKK